LLQEKFLAIANDRSLSLASQSFTPPLAFLLVP
jgi:hypothetical protein